MYGLSGLAHRPDALCLHDANAIQTGELVGKNDRKEGRNDIMPDLNSQICASEKGILPNLEKIENGDDNLPEWYDVVDKESSIDKTHGMSKDSVNLVAVSADGTKYETELYTDKRVTECELPELIEGESDVREEVRDAIKISQEVSDWFNKEGSIDGEQNKSGDSVNPFVAPANGVNFENETEFYTDKRVTECQLPELIFCFKDGAYQVVKDICIDDGLPSFDKISIENLDLHDEGLLSFLQSDYYINDSLSKETVETSAIVSKTNPFVECDCKADVANECTSEKLTGNGVECFEEIGNVVSNQTNPFLQYDCEIDVANKHSSKNSTGNGDGEFDDIGKVIINGKDIPENLLLVQQLEDDGSHPHHEPFDFDGKEGEHFADQDTSKEAEIANSMTPAVEESKCNEAHEVASDGKLERGSITFDFTSSPPETGRGEKNLQNADTQQPAQTLNTWNTDEEAIDSRTASNRSFFIHHGHGESSFSAVDVSGQIPYSGQVPYSGSISLRSDSSTTSTRSFAFPVLHSEWNSSPVKMAKADRRSYRRHRGWRISRFCCRF